MTGKVVLVGAGCGRDLITVRGLAAVKAADVLIYDDLLDDGLLAETKEGCEKIYVGKRSGKHSHTQDEINALLIASAQKAAYTVRLKGGDSFVFGRGGEELLACQAAGIPCEVIPGVTSAVAVPEQAGIPVTHRGIAQSFTVVTGHSASGQQEDYEALARLQGTLVFLMGLHNCREICERLIAYGKPQETPSAVISRGFSAGERRIDGTLRDIADRAADAETPAILVVGETAAFHLHTASRRPLEGVTVNIAGTAGFVKKLAHILREQGAEVTTYPILKVVPQDESVYVELAGFSWLVFTSANGVEVFFDGLAAHGKDIRCLGDKQFACIGEGTAQALAAHGIHADLVPVEYTAAALGKALAESVENGARVLILRAENGSAELTEALLQGGMDYHDAKIYRVEADAQTLSQGFRPADYTVFGSAFGVQSCLSRTKLPENSIAVCIGETTALALQPYGVRDVLIAQPHTAAGIVQTVLAHHADIEKKAF